MRNKENNKGRPTIYFKHPDNEELLIAVPFSSQDKKYEQIIEKKIQKKKYIKSITMVEINKRKSAILIQNMFPIRKSDISHFHKENGKIDTIEGKIAEELYNNLIETYERHRKGERVLETKFDAMEKVLVKEIELEKLQKQNKEKSETVEINKRKYENLQYNISTGKIYQNKLAQDLDKAAKYRKYSKGEWITKKELNNGVAMLKDEKERTVKLDVLTVKKGKVFVEKKEFYNREQLIFTKTQEQNLKAPNFKELEERKSQQEKTKDKSITKVKDKGFER